MHAGQQIAEWTFNNLICSTGGRFIIDFQSEPAGKLEFPRMIGDGLQTGICSADALQVLLGPVSIVVASSCGCDR